MNKEWQDYLDALERLEQAIKLTAYHTRVAAEEAEKCANYALLTAYSANEYLKSLKHEQYS